MTHSLSWSKRSMFNPKDCNLKQIIHNCYLRQSPYSAHDPWNKELTSLWWRDERKQECFSVGLGLRLHHNPPDPWGGAHLLPIFASFQIDFQGTSTLQSSNRELPVAWHGNERAANARGRLFTCRHTKGHKSGWKLQRASGEMLARRERWTPLKYTKWFLVEVIVTKTDTEKWDITATEVWSLIIDIYGMYYER